MYMGNTESQKHTHLRAAASTQDFALYCPRGSYFVIGDKCLTRSQMRAQFEERGMKYNPQSQFVVTCAKVQKLPSYFKGARYSYSVDELRTIGKKAMEEGRKSAEAGDRSTAPVSLTGSE